MEAYGAPAAFLLRRRVAAVGTGDRVHVFARDAHARRRVAAAELKAIDGRRRTEECLDRAQPVHIVETTSAKQLREGARGQRASKTVVVGAVEANRGAARVVVVRVGEFAGFRRQAHGDTALRVRRTWTRRPRRLGNLFSITALLGLATAPLSRFGGGQIWQRKWSSARRWPPPPPAFFRRQRRHAIATHVLHRRMGHGHCRRRAGY